MIRDFVQPLRTIVLACCLVAVAACTGTTATPQATPAPTVAPTSAAWQPEFVDGVLQPLPNGFPDQPITIAVQGEAGSDDGIYARNLQQAATGISPVPVNVIDRPDLGNQWEMLRWVAEQPGGKDGLILQVATFPGVVFDLLVLPIAKDWGVGMDSFDTVRITEHVPWVLISRTDAPWGNDVNAMIEWAKAHPGELKALIRGPDSGTTIAWQSFAKKVGITANEIVGGSSSEIVTSIGAGAGDVAVTIVGTALPVIESGRAVLLSCTGTLNPCAGPGDPVPPMSAITGDLDPWGANRALTINENTPPEQRAWMEAFVDAVVETDQFKQSRQLLPGYVEMDGDNEDALAINQAAYDVGYEILDAQGLLDPSVKNP